jgi:hypothetical protein
MLRLRADQSRQIEAVAACGAIMTFRCFSGTSATASVIAVPYGPSTASTLSSTMSFSLQTSSSAFVGLIVVDYELDVSAEDSALCVNVFLA